ncbi:hypothetical protein V8C43DRAFT_294525 [Trichoderma afarasin]
MVLAACIPSGAIPYDSEPKSCYWPAADSTTMKSIQRLNKMETKRKLGRTKENAAGMTKKKKQRKRRTKKVSYKHKYHLWLGSNFLFPVQVLFLLASLLVASTIWILKMGTMPIDAESWFEWSKPLDGAALRREKRISRKRKMEIKNLKINSC